MGFRGKAYSTEGRKGLGQEGFRAGRQEDRKPGRQEDNQGWRATEPLFVVALLRLGFRV